jgi:hypothetical protein
MVDSESQIFSLFQREAADNQEKASIDPCGNRLKLEKLG